MVMSTLEPAELAELMQREKIVLLPYAEYQALLAQAKTLQSIRALVKADESAPDASKTNTLWDDWRVAMDAWIEGRPEHSASDKLDLKDQVGKIAAECNKGPEMSLSRLEKLINTLAVIGPDVFEVAMATLANPLAGLGVALKKIGDRTKLERRV